MRRARHHQSWSDSMASSITLSGSMSMGGRQSNSNGSRLARPGPSTSYPNQTLSRLVREFNASIIDEESDEEDEGARTGMTAEAQRPDHVQPRSSRRRMTQSERSSSARRSHSQQTSSLADSAEPEGSVAQSRRQKAALTIKRRTRRLLYLITYYLSRFMHDLGSTSITYRPLQFGVY